MSFWSLSNYSTTFPVCQRCCCGDETINHLLFKCQFAEVVWRCINTTMGRVLIFTDNLEDNIKMLINIQQQQHQPYIVQYLPFWLMWRIWKSRNGFIFRKINRHPATEATKAEQDIKEWFDNTRNATSSNQEQNPRNGPITRRRQTKRWNPPPVGWLKCNFDSGYVEGKTYTRSGWIIRDSNGTVIRSGASKLQQAHSVLQAEALGFLNALQEVWNQGLRYVWFKGDNLELINLINKQQDHQRILPLLFDIRYWMAKLPHSSLGHVTREENKAADKLSHFATEMFSQSQSFHVLSRWLTEYL
ncbi:PREDICTED: uncharacterized protein LOC104707721 [Camelina sativa]|uniref:Uncharacterized protein LOC104707721 n=1 Tax=Camelina sativa TaxID=90675 RepID=A0ABM0T8E6_CAMSA|nr:PREDICTED: uncharacterized protein LOC104707721 [Camelina sativa]